MRYLIGVHLAELRTPVVVVVLLLLLLVVIVVGCPHFCKMDICQMIFIL